MYRRQGTQIGLESRFCRACSVCGAINPNTEPAYGCPECGDGGTLSWYGGEIPDVCPSCGDGKLELMTENACANCGEGEVEELEIITCPWCGEERPKGAYHPCRQAPRPSYESRVDGRKKWTPARKGKMAYVRLECRAKEDKVNYAFGYCEGWQKKVERYFQAGETTQFAECLECAVRYRGPGHVLVEKVEDYAHQTRLKTE